jgi:hypothetical protein
VASEFSSQLLSQEVAEGWDFMLMITLLHLKHQSLQRTKFIGIQALHSASCIPQTSDIEANPKDTA